MTTQQLPLLPAPTPSESALRISDRTRRLGLARVAQARLILDEAARRRAEQEAADAAERHAAAEQAASERAARRFTEATAA